MTAKTAPKVTLWEFFQQLGKTFMLPVALLSFCGIMLGIGSSLSSHDVITLIPVLGNPVFQAIFTWMSKIGSFAFSFLPVMFCIAIPLGLARENKGVALMNPLMILVKIIKLRWIHILSYDQMVSRKINNQTTRCAN
ncbi:PTS transporter subunit EIIC, partial [Escherichia coli]|uniref:PTS transporter subunit EIIC n=1 Tax=Escherichia coli TaxID=562 RepID=UPI0020233483